MVAITSRFHMAKACKLVMTISHMYTHWCSVQKSHFERTSVTITYDRYVQTPRCYPFYHVAVDLGICFTTICKRFKRISRGCKLVDDSAICCLTPNVDAIRESEILIKLMCGACHVQWNANLHVYFRCKMFLICYPPTRCVHQGKVIGLADYTAVATQSAWCGIECNNGQRWKETSRTAICYRNITCVLSDLFTIASTHPVEWSVIVLVNSAIIVTYNGLAPNWYHCVNHTSENLWKIVL